MPHAPAIKYHIPYAQVSLIHDVACACWHLACAATCTPIASQWCIILHWLHPLRHTLFPWWHAAVICHLTRLVWLQVRELLKEGSVDQAVTECTEVTETLLDDLLNNGAAYREYVDGWELQRKYAVSEAALDVDLSAPAKKV